MRQWFVALMGVLAIPAQAVPSDGEPDWPSASIVGGSSVGVCGWPTTVYTGGCTGTLIHERAISTAQHCGAPRRIEFGEQAGELSHAVNVLGCVGRGSDDAMICELAEPVTSLPVTPVLFGCEAERYLVKDQPVVMVGFGQTAFGVGGGRKLWADQTIAAVESGRVIIGEPGDGVSPCPGDSGGPAFVQLDDGSWRVIGTVLGGTTGTPCNSAANFQRIDTVVANFEAERGLDITPCFDAATGAWEPTEACGGFFAGNDEGEGTWNDWCEGTDVSGYSESCGAPFESNDPGGTDDTDDPDQTDGTDDTDGVQAGCGCSHSAPAGGYLAFALVSVLIGGTRLRRR
ncbi:MAG: trypsin-like serine protease [Myxococcota bacterium]